MTGAREGVATSPGEIAAFDAAAPDPSETETATFALGCFWGPDVTFGAVEGVVRTRVGYAGGTTTDPTYRDIGDHSETLQVDYDPGVVSFPELVDLAVANHDPRGQPRKRQYQSVLFYESEREREAIEGRLDELRATAETRVEPLDRFHLAEDYHQKYNLRSDRAAMSAFEEAGYDDADVRESPAAARFNAAVAGKTVPDLARVEE